MPPRDAPPNPTAEAVSYAYTLYATGHGGRTFTHPDGGVRWFAVEVDAAGVPGACGRTRCLLFVGGGVVRRVWEYPEGWYLLDDADLAVVSEGV